MNYGLYLSASGALTSMHRQDVHANNLANMNTVGFKPDAVDLRQRLPHRLEAAGGAAAFADPREMLERLGGGLFVQPTRPSLAPGELVPTGNDLDVAIEGNGFFAVAPEGASARDALLTRDGRFTLAPDGTLVTAAGGLRVLDDRGRAIRLDPAARAVVDESGAIRQNGGVVARLRTVAIDDARDVAKVGDNTLRHVNGELPRGQADGLVRQGYTETAAVDPVMAMTDMMNAAKAAQANLKMMQYHDHVLGLAFGTVGRVA